MTTSQHADRFNHDDWAQRYDSHVKDESNPFRHGYARTLDWVVEKARLDVSESVVDLGIGTGNLAQRLPPARSSVGVDVSAGMLGVAATKVPAFELVQDDLLSWAHGRGPLDVAVSTYALHHLEAAEKDQLLKALTGRMRPGGRIVIGDLGFASAAIRASELDRWSREGKSRLVAAVEEEFFWDVSAAESTLTKLGCEVEVESTGRLSWGIAARLV